LQASYVEHDAIYAVVDGDASLTVLERYAKHHGKEDYEQERSQYAALLRAVRVSHPITRCQLSPAYCRCSLGQGGRVSTRSDVATSDIDVFDVTMADNIATPFRRHFPF